MPTPERIAEQFEEHRPHVRAVAYRMLGSVNEAEDAVQEAWIRLSRTDVSGVDNLRGWLTTVVARLAYAGFAITLGSALVAHLSVGDGPEAWGWAAATGVLWGLSYFFWRRVQATPASA